MGKKSWAWGKIVLDVPPLGEDPFLDGLADWMESPEGQLADEAREIVWPALDAAQIDAQGQQIIWPDATSLDIQQTVRRLYESHPYLGEALIEDKVISWLEMEYSPDDYSPKQMRQFERQIDRWIKSHRRQSRRRKID
jgi:hypothetical protein